jgi:TPR repeat protein
MTIANAESFDPAVRESVRQYFLSMIMKHDLSESDANDIINGYYEGTERGISNLEQFLTDEDVIEILKIGAEAGDAACMFDLALEIEDTDPKVANNWLLQAASLNYPPACLNLGVDYFEKQEFEQALPLFVLAADDGDDWAMMYIGEILISQNKHSEALQWLEKSSKLGNLRAAEILSELNRS